MAEACWSETRSLECFLLGVYIGLKSPYTHFRQALQSRNEPNSEWSTMCSVWHDVWNSPGATGRATSQTIDCCSCLEQLESLLLYLVCCVCLKWVVLWSIPYEKMSWCFGRSLRISACSLCVSARPTSCAWREPCTVINWNEAILWLWDEQLKITPVILVQLLLLWLSFYKVYVRKWGETVAWNSTYYLVYPWTQL